MAELFQVHNPVNSNGKPRIVFIHGLGGHFRHTWMANAKNDDTLWPKWVGQETGCPVWLLNYGAAMSRWKADAMAIPRQATAVLECLSAEAAMLEGPLLLVGHSLGGLVIKTALNQGVGRDVERHKRIALNIKGIAFVGTPHAGSIWASIVAWFRLMRVNPQVSDLRIHSAHLEELNHFFLKHCQDLSIKTRVFIETQPLRLPWMLGRLLPGVTIVSPTSSQAHVPGDVGIPIEANHISICKPLSQSAIIHTSMVAFIREVHSTTQARSFSPPALQTPLPSIQFEAISPRERPRTRVHLAFATYGVALTANTDVPVCGTVCLVTDSPDRLQKALMEIRTTVQSDPLVPRAAKESTATASLSQLAQSPGTREIVLRSLAVTSFSAYLYYCPRTAFDQLSPEDKIRHMFVAPIAHRLSKKVERFEQVHSRLPEMPEYLKQAAIEVERAYYRTPELPRMGAPKYCGLEELASLVAAASCAHLGNLNEESASALFENLRTRVRYAENIATGEKHKRDVNPLP